MRTIYRTILETTCKKEKTGETKVFYGRYDPVTLERQHWRIQSTKRVKYEMSDEEFAKHAKIKEVIENYGTDGQV